MRQDSSKTSQEGKQIVLYIIWGALTVAANLIIFYFLNNKLGMAYQVAEIIDWIIILFISFFVNKVLVFKSTTHLNLREFLYYASSRLFTLLVELALLWFFISLLKNDAMVSKVISHGTALILNYLFSRIIFNNKKAT
ncbi:GtrA family protein [Lactococcus sp.]|uniref:GtrA family protein n=1 Tax=Lactococcus sp. TaxID=44273 RepID=UPI0035B3CA54